MELSAGGGPLLGFSATFKTVELAAGAMRWQSVAPDVALDVDAALEVDVDRALLLAPLRGAWALDRARTLRSGIPTAGGTTGSTTGAMAGCTSAGTAGSATAGGAGAGGCSGGSRVTSSIGGRTRWS